MEKTKDLTGKQFNFLTVLGKDLDKPKGKGIYWKCKCQCGKIISIKTNKLNSGQKSCGCHTHIIDTKSLINKKFGRLTVIERDLNKEIGHQKNSYWVCKCECGKILSVNSAELKRGSVKSCGCLKSELLSKRNSIDILNKKFGKLTAVERTNNKNKHNSWIWKCQCDCGKIKLVSAEDLLQRKIISCGCHKQSIGEQIIAQILDENKIYYISQYTNNDLISDQGGYLRFDFAIFDKSEKLIKLIEFDGEQHYNKNSKFYSDRLIELDSIKNNYAINHKIPLTRIPYKELKHLSLELILGDKYNINN